jgi:hypothetical protein
MKNRGVYRAIAFAAQIGILVVLGMSPALAQSGTSKSTLTPAVIPSQDGPMRLHQGRADTAAGPDSVAVEEWRAVMTQNPPQEAGCFHEKFPSLVREKVACLAPSRRFHTVYRAPTGGGPEEAGNRYDYVAETSGTTSYAKGQFLDVTVSSENSAPVYAYGTGGIYGPNEYTLQINTNTSGKSGACIGNSSKCQVWQQFVYATDYGCGNCGTAGLFIQYWLLHVAECPNSNWNQSGNNCWINLNVVGAPDFPITDLESLSLVATTQVGGQDCANLFYGKTEISTSCSSDILGIASVWTQTEFGVFGDGGGAQAQFGFGTNFAQLLQVYDGSDDVAPTCLYGHGTTGETNSLKLSKCEVLTGNGLYPRIRFVLSEYFLPPPPLPTACGLIFKGHGLTPGQAVFSCDGQFELIMQTDGNLVLYENGVTPALWNTGTEGQDVAYMIMQEDGNLVVYNTSEVAVWNSQTDGYEGGYLAIQNDGNLVIYKKTPSVPQNAVWSSGTCCH